MCFNESLRIEPALSYSSKFKFNKDIKLDKFTIKANEMMSVNLHHIHRLPNEWQEPEKFIPERFDPASSYFLRPDGKKRHPYAFTPFLGGKRMCIGKTFVETMSKIVGPTLIGHFNFEYIDKILMTEKPLNNLFVTKEP
jgi:cytochrome P450